ncbi:hypothetical protein BD324DRAFT_639126 [Kockovaella imperatae]|uniref:Uncharacterized protein n=1 Tax=Kockovaella imperatae TaxID=4999 RepID=A0A1Y1U6L2_9TREE|nr:hypothetical protein BD324DRAFT_639126 [Kockovaella imperatae]ORX33671.1 hypothetical protein BD324DRAFT_639126 [Kockovaella imperatae]
MVSTRSRKSSGTEESGDKRSAPQESTPKSKKPKTEHDGKLKVSEGEIGLSKQEDDDEEDQSKTEDEKETGEEKEASNENKEESKPSRDEPHLSGILEEPKHGTLESGHIYFLYRPKVDAEEVDSVDDISKFHILLIPTSHPYGKSHYHRIIEVGKKKLPDPHASRQVIWGLVGNVGSDKAELKNAFGAYDYETKTKGTRHQSAARPAARGHYILHSPRDELADSPDHDRQRDFKILLAYEITTPASEDFGQVQSDLGIAEKGAVALQVKSPEAESTNPRAASIPKDKRASYPKKLDGLFANRRFIPANPPSFLDYSGGELLLLSSAHDLAEWLGKDGKKIVHDLDNDASKEQVGIDGAMKELGMSKKDTEIEALEGVWA